MIVEIDQKAGFCFGVTKAIQKVEQLLSEGKQILCLGDIVHNKTEVNRLEALGMQTIQREELANIFNSTILIRSHGEPPSTYDLIKANSNELIEATCPVVLKLQQRIESSNILIKNTDGQLVIYGKAKHPEVIGLVGQTNNEAIVIASPADLEKIDFNKPIELYSQTTMPVDGFQTITSLIKQKANNDVQIHNTICKQVSGRVQGIQDFAAKYGLILFVSGKASSNGKFLFQMATAANKNTHFISSIEEIEKSWFKNIQSVGISGATSTPMWLMEETAQYILQKFDNEF